MYTYIYIYNRSIKVGDSEFPRILMVMVRHPSQSEIGDETIQQKSPLQIHRKSILLPSDKPTKCGITNMILNKIYIYIYLCAILGTPLFF